MSYCISLKLTKAAIDAVHLASVDRVRGSTSSSRQHKQMRHSYRTLYIHTHPFNGPFSGTTQVSQYQKGETSLDFTEARDSKWQWHQLNHMQVCTSLQTDNHASTPPLRFLQAGCPSCRPTNSIKALKAFVQHIQSLNEILLPRVFVPRTRVRVNGITKMTQQSREAHHYSYHTHLAAWRSG